MNNDFYFTTSCTGDTYFTNPKHSLKHTLINSNISYMHMQDLIRASFKPTMP